MTDPTHKTDAEIDRARCQALTAFREIAPFGMRFGAVSDRMRCTNQAQVVAQGVHLCGIHSFSDESTAKAIRSAWKGTAHGSHE